MKKLLSLLLAALLFTLPAAAMGETVVTSFYPIYLFALNLTQGVEGLEDAGQGAGISDQRRRHGKLSDERL